MACKHEWHDVSTISKPEWACSKCKVLYSDMSPKRPWVGLTDEDIALIDWESFVTKKDCVQAIEAKLKERNHG